MPAKTIPLTAREIAAVPLAKSRQELSLHDSDESRIRGLRLMVTPAGRRTFYFVYKLGPSIRKIRLEEFKPSHFADHQRPRLLEAVNRLQLAREQGMAPEADYLKRQAAARKEAREAREDAHRPTLKTVVKDYLKAISDPKSGRYKKTWREDDRLLRKDVLPKLGTRIADELTRDDYRAVIREVARRGKVVANRTQTALSTCLNWAVDEGKVSFNVLRGMRKEGGAEKSRDRDLSEPEIKAFWHGLSATYTPTYKLRGKERTDQPIPVVAPENALALKLLLLTGVRRAEVARARWSEVDWKRRQWEIPGARTKSGAPLVVPLSRVALELLRELQKITGTTPYWLPGKRRRGRDAFEYTTKPTRPETLSHALLDARERGAFGDTATFTVHDLRRTLRTRIVMLGVDRDTAERLLNHRVGSKVEQTYDRYSYLKERRDALQRWGEYVMGLVAPAANIVRIRR